MSDAVNERRCRKCGKPADDECSRCKDAIYCSRECQRWDYRIGGHRALCKGPPVGRKMNNILRELFAAEWTWLKSLSRSERQELFKERFSSSPLNHVLSTGVAALVLARVNPCAIFDDGWTYKPAYGPKLFNLVIEPWYEKHKAFLNEEGFVIEYMNRPVLVDDGESLRDYGETTLIKDMRSSKTDLIAKVFDDLRTPILSLWTVKDAVTWKDVADCMVFRPSSCRLLEDGSSVVYFFRFPSQALG